MSLLRFAPLLWSVVTKRQSRFLQERAPKHLKSSGSSFECPSQPKLVCTCGISPRLKDPPASLKYTRFREIVGNCQPKGEIGERVNLRIGVILMPWENVLALRVLENRLVAVKVEIWPQERRPYFDELRSAIEFHYDVALLG